MKLKCKKVVKNIREYLKFYIEDNKLKSLIIGVSGGIDSALCSVLAKPVCDELDIPLIGRSIPIESNKEEEIERANMIGDNFCTEFNEVDLTSTYLNLKDTLITFNNEEVDKSFLIRMGNLKARIRMIFLYDLAKKNKGMVLSTDNYTEYLLGFWTLMGDVGDFGMIQNLWKTEVYKISKWLFKKELITDKDKRTALQSCIYATPTDGLGITDSDLEQLGAESYKEVDRILKSCINYDCNMLELEHPVYNRYMNTEFKRNHPYNIPRDLLL